MTQSKDGNFVEASSDFLPTTGELDKKLPRIPESITLSLSQAWDATKLPHGWDDEDAGPVDVELASLVSVWLVELKQQFEKSGKACVFPSVWPGPGDTFDLHWSGEDKGFNLLMNVCLDGRCTYYGHKFGHPPILQGGGKLGDDNVFEWIMGAAEK